MKINKNQALYKALPGSWITFGNSSNSDYRYACNVTKWNYKRIIGVNEEMMKNDINRRVSSFVSAGGDVDENLLSDSVANMLFVEPAMVEDIQDIRCKINPKTFYCEKCGKVFYSPKAKEAPICPDCKIKTKQLGLIYACHCGFADGVKPNSKEQLYFHSKEKENQFKFFTKSGLKREMECKCPVCGEILFPKNATDHRLFNAQSGNLVNLYNVKYASLLNEYKAEAEMLMLAKWFGLISSPEFVSVLDRPKDFFEHKGRSVDDPEVLLFAKSLNKSPQEIVDMLSANETNLLTIGNIRTKINNILSIDGLGVRLKLITSDLIEFDTLKNAKSVINLEEAIKKGISVGNVIDPDDIYEILKKMGISNIQVSEAVQIVNYAYGYTRMQSCPDGGTSKRLKLKGFNGKTYTSILETEGILVELDMFKVFDWLLKNGFVSDDVLITSEEEAKTWFLENINLESINHYQTISGQNSNLATKAVYSLLHTISHMFIISAGKHSGLSKDSISEMIFPETCALFIYPTTTEGVTLGSISGMFETDLQQFLEDALKDNEICTFDPVCSNNQNGACVACCYLSEVNCCHFNKDLSRSYLYSGTIKINDDELIVKKGFWK